MKRAFLMILAVVLCLGLCACGTGGAQKESEVEETPNDKVATAVKNQIMVQIALQYDTTGVPTITTYVSKVSENLYEVTGKVTVHDKYGDSYTGKYDAEVKYNSVTKDCDVKLSMDTLYKD